MGGTKRQLEREAILPQGRHPVVTLQMDFDAHQMLIEMTSTKSRGAFLAGLVRAEYARQLERLGRKRAGKPSIDERLVAVEH